MSGIPTETLSEPELNDLLRAVDWRFLLGKDQRPRALVLGAPRTAAEGVALVADPATEGSGEADLVVLGYPTRGRLRRARAALGPEGDLVCLWQWPRIAGVQRARARLRRAGFEATSVHWPGPHPGRRPDFWLPLGAPAVAAHLFDPAAQRSRRHRLQRHFRRLAETLGALAPICLLARGSEAASADRRSDEIGAALAAGPVLLLTEGTESRHKVVCLSFSDAAPAVTVKCSRTPLTDRSLKREAEILQALQERRPDLDLAPRVIASGSLAGRLAVAESVVPGRLPPEPLTEAAFAQLAPPLTERLLELVDESPPQPPPHWRRRLVEEPLDRFEDRFAARLGAKTIAAARLALAELPDLPLAWEHRDCAVWNLHLDGAGTIGMFDWAGSDPRGLPGLDLAYFLATSAFMIDRVEMSHPRAVLDSHLRLLDAESQRGRVAAACVEQYCGRLGLNPAAFPLLRLRAWIVKADPEDPAAASFADLAAAEVRRIAPREGSPAN